MSMLGFFRKRQKLIFIIMVVLMVSFLIGFQGFSMLFSKKPGKETIGQTPDEKFSLDMLRQARGDLEILRLLMPGFGMSSAQGLAFQAMHMASRSQEQVSLAYMLLQAEAGLADRGITEGEVDDAIAQMTNRGFDYEGLAGNLRQNRGMPEKTLRGILARWLGVFKNYEASSVIVPPSQAELLNLFRDLNEKMNLSVVKLPAESLLDKFAQAKPTDAQAQAQFDKYKNRLPGRFSGFDSFDFGYLQPPRVAIAYLFVNQTAVQRATKVPLEDIQDFYNNNQAQFTEESGQVKTFADARSEIIEKLAPQASAVKFQQILEEVRQALSQARTAEGTKTGGKIFDEIVAKYTIPATELLLRKIPVVAIEQQPLQEAIATLAELVSPRLTAICFPWGKFDSLTIDPKIKVSLIGRNLTVAEALAKLAGQIPGLPKLQWACFPGLDGVVFPVAGVRLFPLTAQQSDLLPLEQLRKNKLLASAASREQRAWLLQMAMQVDAMNLDQTQGKGKSKLKLRQLGPVATVWTQEGLSGQVLWMVTDAKPAHSPAEISPEIHKQISRDWQLAQAFDEAVKQTQAIKTAEQMQALVKARKLTPVETGLVARRMRSNYGGGMFRNTSLPMLKFSDGVVDMYFLGKAFDALAPKNPNKPYEKNSAQAMVLPLKSQRGIYLARRTDFLPAMEQKFEQEKSSLILPLRQSQYIMTLRDWFTLGKIVERTGFVEEHAGMFLAK